MAGNSILPVYQNMASSTSSTSPSPAPASVSSYVTSTKAFVGEMAEAGKTMLTRQRPWSEVLDRNSFVKPDSIADATSRISKNVSYFRVNYAVVSAAIVFIGLLWHPGSLIILLVLAAAWFFLYISRSEPVVLFNRSYGEREVLAILGVITFATIFFTSTWSTLITGLAMAASLVAVHAAFRTPDDLFLENPESVTQNHRSFSPSGYSSLI